MAFRSVGSTSGTAGLRPAVTLSHDGASKPERINSSRPATLGCLLRIIWRLSAQLDHMLRLWSRRHCATPNIHLRGRLTTSQNVVLTRVGSEPCGETHHEAPPATGNSGWLQRREAESTHIEDLRHSRSAQATGRASQRRLTIVNVGCLKGVPNTVTPCSSSGNEMSPRHTIASASDL